MKLMAKAAEMLTREIGHVEYNQLILKAYGMPLHEIPDDPQLLIVKLKEMVVKIMNEGISDERYFRVLAAVSEAGSPEVKKFVAAELMVIQAMKKKLEGR